VEGIAQFYTWAVCNRIEDRAAGVRKAYDALLSIQGGPYVVHSEWIENANRVGETMRACLIDTRTHGIQKIDVFQRNFTEIQSRLEKMRDIEDITSLQSV
jgi:hypothetical protein